MLACRLQAESKHSRKPDAARRDAALLKCDGSFLSLTRSALDRYGSASCTSVEPAAMQSHLARFASGLELSARRGGVLIDCDADLDACVSDLDTCNDDVAARTAERDASDARADACDADLGGCRSSLATSQESLSNCASERAAATASLQACSTAAATCNTDLASCNAAQANCASSLAACTTGASTCNGDLATCRADASTCTTTLAACESSSDACVAELAAARSGDASAADVRSGRVFTSAAGDSQAGSMPDRGAVSIVPGALPQAIPGGFHDGSGVVAGDPDLVPANIRAGRSIFGIEGTSEPGTASAPTASGETADFGFGSDGGLQLGSAPSFVDNGDGTVTDRRTGLTWEKKTRDGSIHDVDATFTWGQSSAPFALNGSVVSDFLRPLDTVPCFAGHCDWRLPNLRELQTIVDYGRGTPAVDPVFHSGCVPGCDVSACSCSPSTASADLAWTATSRAGSPGEAWAVAFGSGSALGVGKASALRVRAVRGGTSATDLCSVATTDPSDTIAAAACKAIGAFARNDFDLARDYLLADVVARRFRVAALGGMWPMFLQTVAFADAGAQLYTRIGDASKTATSSDLAALEGVDAATGPALFCASLPYPSGYADLLADDLLLGGYETTHVLLALLWMRDQGCPDPTPPGFRDQALAATAMLIDGDHEAITDLEVEAAALLAAMGAPARVPAGFLPGLLAAQLPSGAWRAGPGEAPLGHTTGLAMWYLHEVRLPDSSVPTVAALPR